MMGVYVVNDEGLFLRPDFVAQQTAEGSCMDIQLPATAKAFIKTDRAYCLSNNLALKNWRPNWHVETQLSVIC